MFAAGYATGDHPLRFLKSCGVNAIDGKNWPWLNSGDCITHESTAPVTNRKTTENLFSAL